MGNKLNVDDCVRIVGYDTVEKEYGVVRQLKKNCALVRVYSSWEDEWFSYDEIEFMPMKILPVEELRAFSRFQLSYNSLIAGAEPEHNFDVEDNYEIQLEDMEIALRNMKAALEGDDGAVEAILQWSRDLYWSEDDYLVCLNQDEDSDDADILENFDAGILAEKTLKECIFKRFCEFSFINKDNSNAEYPSVELIERMLADIQAWREGGRIYTWTWSRDQTIDVISGLKDKELEVMDEETLSVIRKKTDQFCAEGEPRVLERTGWFYYGGNKLYPCNWEKSRDIFLRLMDMEEVDDQKKCYYANTLGYIFYYGRCNNGVPEYEKALKYYSIGAAGWIYESIYKLSDMYLHGYGTPVNKLAAANYIHFIYEDNLKNIQNEQFDCKFADVALRMGNLCRAGAIEQNAYYYYTLADYAIRKRLPYGHYGDANVFTGIQKELDKIRKDTPLTDRHQFTGSEPYAIRIALAEYTCKITFKKVKDGIKITARRIPKPNEDKARKFFLCLTECGYCELMDKVSETALEAKEYWTFNGESKCLADEMEIEDHRGKQQLVFLHHGECVARIVADDFRLKLPVKKEIKSEKYRFASVTFTPGGRTYDYLTGDIDLVPGDFAIVNANGEDKVVAVERVFVAEVSDLPIAIERYKHILRKV